LHADRMTVSSQFERLLIEFEFIETDGRHVNDGRDA
jgi:hypothetical protein